MSKPRSNVRMYLITTVLLCFAVVVTWNARGLYLASVNTLITQIATNYFGYSQ